MQNMAILASYIKTADSANIELLQKLWENIVLNQEGAPIYESLFDINLNFLGNKNRRVSIFTKHDQ